MAVTVSRPIGNPGATNATCGSFAVRPTSASSETCSPVAIATPTYAPSASIAPKVVAVPKLITIAGAPTNATAPIAPAIRSLPTSVGRSVRTTIERCVAAVKNAGCTPKYFSQPSRSGRSTTGTTDDTTIDSTSRIGKCAAEKNAANSTPNSSAVRRRAVVTRQLPTMAPDASNAPSLVSVLPTSMHNSTWCPRR